MQKLSRTLHLACAVSVMSVLSGCFILNKGDASHSAPEKEQLVLPEGSKATVLSEEAGIVTASLGAKSTETQLMTASADSNISSVVIAFLPGSLSIDTNISLRETPTIGSELLLTQLGLSATPTVTNSGAAVEISSSEPIDLLRPMILSLPLPSGFGLAEIDRTRLGVLYRVSIQDTAEKKVGFVPATELNIDGNNNVLYPSSYFGSFQVVVFDQVVPKIEKDDVVPTHDGIEYLLAGTPVPSCGRADVGRTVYVEETNKFQVCLGTGWKTVDLTGPKGDAGSVATAGKGLIYVYDSLGAKLGRYFGGNGPYNYYTQLSDGTNALLDWNGNIGNLVGVTCYYLESDCSGICYGSGSGVRVGDLTYLSGKNVGGVGVHFSSNYKVATRSQSSLTLNYYWNGTSCYDNSANPYVINSYATFQPHTPTLSYTPPLELRVEYTP